MNLATLLRPQTIDQIIGQSHLVGQDKIIKRMVDSKVLSSMILYGPPGIGKTSIATALSGSLGIPFKAYNATIDDKKKLQEFAAIVQKTNKPIIIALDEIHRLDKPKQEFLLSFMEDGMFIVIGTTTENPYITVTPAIRSRCHIFQLQPLNKDELTELVKKGCEKLLTDGIKSIKIDDDAVDLLTTRLNGDARTLLNTLELAIKSTPNHHVTKEIIEECIQQKASIGDKNGDAHYDLLSAFQKSIRGSDADASVYYLAKLIESGDLQAICRRLSVIAFEDIGLGNIPAIQTTMSAIETAKQVGFPEARISLAFATTLLALSPKSNTTYTAINKALESVKTVPTTIPNHLKDTHFKGAAALGHVGYVYPHDEPYHWVRQQYLPDEIKHVSFFETNNLSSQQETQLLERYQKLKGED